MNVLSAICLLLPLAAGQMMVGGLFPVSTQRDDVRKMAMVVMNQLESLKELPADVNGFDIISAKTQVVAGLNYVMVIKFGHTTCNVTVWDRPWINSIRMTQHHCYSSSKRQMLLGGYRPAQIHSKHVMDMANFALAQVNAMTDGSNTMVKVVSARTQVVAGVNYELELIVSDGMTKHACNVTIWDQEWTGMRTMTNYHCQIPAKRQLVGSIHAAHLSKTLHKIVAFAEDALNKKTNNMFRMVTESVSHLTKQLVAGMKYNFQVNLVQSTCMNNEDSFGKSINLCSAATDGQHMSCQVSVLFRQWMKPTMSLLSDSCGQMF